jgi:hypothetical protein
VFKKAQKGKLRGLRLRELEARDLTYIAPMAQIKSETLSQGFPSLQISKSFIAIPERFEHASPLFIGASK